MKALPWAPCAIVVASLLATTDASANQYRLVDLGQASVYAINDRNVVAGAISPYAPARWRNGQWTDLDNFGVANGINDRGQIAGWATAPDGRQDTPIIWERPKIGGARFIGLPEGFEWGEAKAISNDGAVIGYFGGDASGTGCFLAQDGYHPEFLNWPLELGCIPFALNRSGQIAGYVRDEHYNHQAFIWTDGEFELLSPVESDSSAQAEGINDRGEAVGTSSLYQFNAVLWRHGKAVKLDTTDRFVSTEAHGINNHGVIVGDAQLPPKNDDHEGRWVAVRYEGGQAIYLKDEIENLSPNWHLASAVSVNSAGVIIGYGSYGRDGHSFALYPIEGDEAEVGDPSSSAIEP
jgi:uncharacterized membrane protein